MLHLKVVELTRGVWRASIDGEEQSAAIDRAPDQALAGLVRANLGRFGIAEIIYASEADDAQDRPGVGSQGEPVFPLNQSQPVHRKEGT